MKNRSSSWLLMVIILVGVPFWWLLIDADRGVAPPKPVHIGELRTLAAILPGPRPTAVTYTLLAKRRTVGDIYAAGVGLKRRSLAIVSWTLPVPGKGPIMIDPDASSANASGGPVADFDHAAQARIDATAKTASLILETQGPQSEPPRHGYSLGKAGISIGRAAPAAQLSYITAQAVAPGVVVIPASSHAPGANLIFVQLADGREFLFAGDIAPFIENWLRLRARSHLAALWDPVQDRAQTYAWLRTIRQLRSEAPKMQVVPGHDPGWLTMQRAGGAISEWQPDPLPPVKAHR